MEIGNPIKHLGKYGKKSFYKNKKILVTGATGFKGAWLCMWLKILGSKVYGIGHNPNRNKNLFYSLNLQTRK